MDGSEIPQELKWADCHSLMIDDHGKWSRESALHPYDGELKSDFVDRLSVKVPRNLENYKHPNGFSFRPFEAYFRYWKAYIFVEALDGYEDIGLFLSSKIGRETVISNFKEKSKRWEVEYEGIFDRLSFYRTAKTILTLWQGDCCTTNGKELSEFILDVSNGTTEVLERDLEKLLILFGHWRMKEQAGRRYYRHALEQLRYDVFLLLEWLCPLTGKREEMYFRKWGRPNQGYVPLNEVVSFEEFELEESFCERAPDYSNPLVEAGILADVKSVYGRLAKQDSFWPWIRAFSDVHHKLVPTNPTKPLVFRQPRVLDRLLVLAMRTEILIRKFFTPIIHKKGSFLTQVIVLYYGYVNNLTTMNWEETTVEVQDNQLALPFASVSGKQVEAVFDGGALTSDIGLMLLREVASRIGILSRIVEALTDRRHPSYVDHTMVDLISQRVFQIACAYEDANDCNVLREDPAFKAACDRLPISGAPLASQPTMSRLENGIRRRDLYRIAEALVDGFIASYDRPPDAVVLDIDDTDDEVHGKQQLSLFNGYYDERCYCPLHIYEGRTGRLITTLLRPGARPTGKQIVSILKRLVKILREAWPDVRIFLRGDGHFSCPEVHDFCDEQDVYFVLGQTGNARLAQRGHALIEQAKAQYRETGQPVQLFTCFAYQADTWAVPRRIIYKAEITASGQANTRFVVTNLKSSQPSFIYKTVYCARGRMENFIKNHKTFLHSDRTSCHTFEANHFRLFLHSAAYVLMQTLTEKGLRATQWTHAQFNTIQNRILKVAGRVSELKTKIKLHLPTSFPLKHLYDTILCNLAKAYP